MRQTVLMILLVIIQIAFLYLCGFFYFQIESEDSCKTNINEIEKHNETTLSVKTSEKDSNKSVNCVSRSVPYSYSDCVFFIFTIVTTIGYGNTTPKTDMGKLFTIFVAFLGIPLNLLLLAKLGEIFKHLIRKISVPVKKFIKTKKRYVLFQLGLSFVLGTISFIIIPAIIIMSLEEWSYLEAFYFTVITIFTIGFGDYVAAADKTDPTIYELGIYIWISLGMAYIALMINLTLEFWSARVDNLGKEIVEVIEEKLMPNNYSLTGKRKSTDLIIDESTTMGTYHRRKSVVRHPTLAETFKIPIKHVNRDNDLNQNTNNNYVIKKNNIRVHLDPEEIINEAKRRHAMRNPSFLDKVAMGIRSYKPNVMINNNNNNDPIMGSEDSISESTTESSETQEQTREPSTQKRIRFHIERCSEDVLQISQSTNEDETKC